MSANDPGGANTLIPVARALIERGDTVRGVVSGPAVQIFARNNIPYTEVELAMEVNRLIKLVDEFQPDSFISGTSVGKSIDKQILLHIRGRIPSIYILDFWNNYAERFSSDGTDLAHMPDLICVMDDLARDTMVQAGFPLGTLRVTGNPHFEHFADTITKDTEDMHQILYISGPISDDVKNSGLTDPGFDEFSVLEGILSATTQTDVAVSIRLHPRDKPHKYDKYLSERVSISQFPTVESAVSQAGIIVGSFSSVLLQALSAGKAVISYQPNAIGEDSLVSNRLGITHKVSEVPELRKAIQKIQVSGGQESFDLNRLFVPNATQNVLAVIDSLVI